MSDAMFPLISGKIAISVALFLLIHNIWSGTTSALNDEGQALIAFRQQITNDPTEILQTWNPYDATPCNWTGISCSNDNSVTRILLQNLQLSGQISRQLLKLPHLRVLSLPNNSFVGSFPSEIAHLPSLWKINVSHNALSGDLGSFGTSLRMLDLSQNAFSGPIPTDFFQNCARLRYISLSGNNLSGALPPNSLGINCSRLVGIDFSRNRLQGSIPEQRGDQPSLQFLNLSFNALSGKIGALPIGANCSNLQVLDLSVNQFSGTIPDTLGSCSRLLFLNVSGNQLSGSIPKQLGSLSFARSIDLSSNKLSGEIPPEIGNLSSLSVLRLGINPIEGSIPPDIGKMKQLIILDMQMMDLQGNIPAALANCSFLQELDLSHNNLTGSITGSLTNLMYLKSLDLEDNKLTGMIPMDLGNLSNLNHLDISVNWISGRIPRSLGDIQALSSLNVSYNSLSGMIPGGALQRFSMSSFLGNAGLCGLPLLQSCTALPMATFGSQFRMMTRVLTDSAIAAIVVAALIALGVVIITIINIRAVRTRRETLVSESIPPPSPHPNPILGKLVLFSQASSSKYEDWETGMQAVRNKECMIGSGTLGTVYRATFDESGISVAIKKLQTLGRIADSEEFEAEIGRLANVRHRNLVVMQGFFWSSTMQLLLCEFIPNGSLFLHLHGQKSGQKHLNWKARFRIAIGTARGLAYLHHHHKPPIVHFDLKSSNILLDNDFEPKISDYGLSKLLPSHDTYISSRRFDWALGYVAPELTCQGIPLTQKCDVYSFGIILMELATGRLPIENDAIVVCEYVQSALEQGQGVSCIDPHLQTGSEHGEIMEVLKLGLVCTSQIPSKRPSMAQAVQVLELIKPDL